MFDMKSAMFLCLSLYILGANAGAVSFIDPCHWNDAKCILTSTKKAVPYVLPGIPELGIPSMDPLVVETVHGDGKDLKLSFKNLVIKGLSKCEIIKIERPVKLKAHLELVCPIVANGQYSASGNLFFTDITGNGDCEIKTDKIKIAATIILKEIEKEGKKYYKFSSFDYNYEPVDIVYFKLDNLFNGDKAKADPINAILKESWKEVISEFGKPVIKELVTHCVTSMEKLFLAIPTNEIELED